MSATYKQKFGENLDIPTAKETLKRKTALKKELSSIQEKKPGKTKKRGSRIAVKGGYAIDLDKLLKWLARIKTGGALRGNVQYLANKIVQETITLDGKGLTPQEASSLISTQIEY